MRRLLSAAVLSVLPFAASAQSYLAINRIAVVPLGGASFEVIEAHGEGARGLWCAAASFAQDRLGAKWAARLYVKSARGPSISGMGRIGVVYTLDRSELSAAPVQSYSVNVTQPGLNLPVGHAIQFCKDYIIELNDL